LGEADPTEIAPGVKSVHAEFFDVDHIREQIHRTRLQLQLYPNDPILWTNLASLYLSIGQNRQAHRSIRVARTRAPENRFVLRSAARVLLHIDRGGEAHSILLRADSLKSDPWVLAAEISIAAALKRTSQHMLLGQKLVEAEKFPPFDASELASEVATIRALDGNTHAAKKLLRRAMAKPCENAIAQAAWLAKVPGMPAAPVQITTSFEANTWITRRTGKLRQSMLHTKQWLNDQPFSGRPAKAGSFIASRINRHDEGIRFAEQGLLCNPDDPILLNNLAFSSARQGEISKARDAINRTNGAKLTPHERHVIMATGGLVAFREGDVTRGRTLYVQAVKWFREKGETAEAVALAYHAMEELRAGTSDAGKLRENAMAIGKKMLHDAEDMVLLKQLADFGKAGTVDDALRPEPTLM